VKQPAIRDDVAAPLNLQRAIRGALSFFAAGHAVHRFLTPETHHRGGRGYAGAHVPLYRCYRLNADGNVFEPARAGEHADDTAARVWARSILDTDEVFSAVGLWQKTRLVEVIRRPGPGGDASGGS
jgi:hypothetical protein